MDPLGRDPPFVSSPGPSRQSRPRQHGIDRAHAAVALEPLAIFGVEVPLYGNNIEFLSKWARAMGPLACKVCAEATFQEGGTTV